MLKIYSFIDRTKRWLGFQIKVRPLISICEDIALGQIRHVASKAGGLGDELMALGVAQAAKRIYPSWKCVFHTRHFTLLKDAPGLDGIVEFEPHVQPNRIELTYRSKSNHSLNQQMAVQLGIDPPDYRIELPRFMEWPSNSTVRDRRVKLAIQTDSSGWTPNKDWPQSHWLEFIESLPSNWVITELGRETLFVEPPKHPGFQSYSGKTSLVEYARMIQKADLFIGPPSGGMHVAHAYKRPSVIIVGGYESNHYPYPLARQLGTNLPCAPCWLRSPCPYDRQCLKVITPAQVLQEAIALLPQNS